MVLLLSGAAVPSKGHQHPRLDRVMVGSLAYVILLVLIIICAEVFWLKDETELRNTKQIAIKVTQQSSSLKICDITMDMQGSYTCRAINPSGQAITSSAISVEGIDAAACHC
jgi:hypothetical protein